MVQRRRSVAIKRKRRGRSTSASQSVHSGYIHVLDGPHELELKVHHALLSDERFYFRDLVVHRIDDGVCLEGLVEATPGAPDVSEVARRVGGVTHVINRLVVCRPQRPPAKG